MRHSTPRPGGVKTTTSYFRGFLELAYAGALVLQLSFVELSKSICLTKFQGQTPIGESFGFIPMRMPGQRPLFGPQPVSQSNGNGVGGAGTPPQFHGQQKDSDSSAAIPLYDYPVVRRASAPVKIRPRGASYTDGNAKLTRAVLQRLSCASPNDASVVVFYGCTRKSMRVAMNSVFSLYVPKQITRSSSLNMLWSVTGLLSLVHDVELVQ